MDSTSSVDTIRTQHEMLHARAAALMAVSKGPPRWRETELELTELADILRAHFEMEEMGGYMSAVLAAEPREAATVRRLKGAHDEIWIKLVELRRCAGAAADWPAAARELSALGHEILRHEEEENTLVARVDVERSGRDIRPLTGAP